MAYPSTLDDFGTALSADTIEEEHINLVRRAVEGLEVEVGIASSTAAGSHEYQLTRLPTQAANWDVGAYSVTATKYISDVASGTSIPFACTSTAKCTNLNADTVDGKDVDGSNGAGEITTNDGTQTLTNKTLTSPAITGGTLDNVTIGGTTAPTVTDLGAVATADINGGTLDGVQIGGTTATGELIVNDSSDNADGLGSQGTTGQALISAGAGSNPTWGSISGTNVQTVYTLNQTMVETSVSNVTSNDTDPFIITEGFETMTRAITGSSSNTVRIDVTVIVASGANTNIVAGLFNTDSDGTNALAVSGFERIVDAHAQLTLHFTFFQALPTSSETTYRVRLSSDSTTSLTVNGGNNVAELGQKMASSLIVTEIKA